MPIAARALKQLALMSKWLAVHKVFTSLGQCSFGMFEFGLFLRRRYFHIKGGARGETNLTWENRSEKIWREKFLNQLFKGKLVQLFLSSFLKCGEMSAGGFGGIGSWGRLGKFGRLGPGRPSGLVVSTQNSKKGFLKEENSKFLFFLSLSKICNFETDIGLSCYCQIFCRAV